jgi:tetratricopeptide (TPR) repeat protein
LKVKSDNLFYYKLEVDWSVNLGCSVKDFLLWKAEGEKYDNILVACSDNKIYELNRNGVIVWTYPLDGRPTSMYIEDVDGDGIDDLLVSVASGSVYALDLSGDFKWRYTIDKPLMKVAAGDMAGDGNKEVAVVTEDPAIKVYNVNETYTERRKAFTLFYLGRDEFLASRNLIQSLAHFKEAKAIFVKLGDEQKAMECQTYIARIEAMLNNTQGQEADMLYARANEYLQTGEYDNALSSLEKAASIYSDNGNSDGIVKCELLKLQIEKIKKTPPTATLAKTTTTTIAELSKDDTMTYAILGVLVLAAVAIIALKIRSSRAGQGAEDEGFGSSKESWEWEMMEEDEKNKGGDKA